MSLNLQQTLKLAVDNHRRGRLSEAEGLYREILEADPGHAEVNVNLGLILQGQGRFEDAAERFRQAGRINPGLAEAHFNLANVLKILGRLDDAITSYRRALSIREEYPEAHNNLGNAMRDQGKLDAAITGYRRALSIRPQYPEAHNNLGNALRDRGELDDAISSYRQALRIKPDFADAHYNLGAALMGDDRKHEAFESLRAAAALEPQNGLIPAVMAECLAGISFTAADDGLFQDLLGLLDLPRVDPRSIAQPIVSALRHHPVFSSVIERASTGKLREDDTACEDAAGLLSSIPLLLRTMESSPLRDLEVEEVLTLLRRAMLRIVSAGKTEVNGPAFLAALALHCFVNEYVFSETASEKEDVERLERKVAALIDSGRDAPGPWIATLAAYRPLHGFSWAGRLLERQSPDGIEAVIVRQIAEPGEERELRRKIPTLTPIRDAVSRAVREQYEENPYPRWIKAFLHEKPRTIGEVLGRALPHRDFDDHDFPANPDILVAGCGTGKQPLTVASKFINARLMAIDLSLASLAYAMRKAGELGVTNIEFIQGDILDIGSLGGQFDIIECTGVLHHLDDPLAGWRNLVDILRPGGVMKIGLYSEAGRLPIVKARALIAERGYPATADGIRRCRRDIVAMAADGDREIGKITEKRDFYSLSDCRDLIFHVQEHRFTLPGIESALSDLGLEFLGFELADRSASRKFLEAHPDERDQSSLSCWHGFELENPETFRAMYQFWVRKPRSL